MEYRFIDESDALVHYGVLGMKWVLRKDGKPQGYQGDGHGRIRNGLSNLNYKRLTRASKGSHQDALDLYKAGYKNEARAVEQVSRKAARDAEKYKVAKSQGNRRVSNRQLRKKEQQYRKEITNSAKAKSLRKDKDEKYAEERKRIKEVWKFAPSGSDDIQDGPDGLEVYDYKLEKPRKMSANEKKAYNAWEKADTAYWKSAQEYNHYINSGSTDRLVQEYGQERIDKFNKSEHRKDTVKIGAVAVGMLAAPVVIPAAAIKLSRPKKK